MGVDVALTIGKVADDPLDTPEDQPLWGIGIAGKSPTIAFYPDHRTETQSAFLEVQTPSTYWEPGDVDLKCIGCGHDWGSALRAALLAYAEELIDMGYESMSEAEADARIADYADEIVNLRKGCL